MPKKDKKLKSELEKHDVVTNEIKAMVDEKLEFMENENIGFLVAESERERNLKVSQD